MSNYHDIHCLDCEGRPGAGWHWNHGGQQLGEILDDVHLIQAAWPMLSKLDITEFRIGYPSSGGYMESARFLVEHANHRLAVMDEYDRVIKIRECAP